jgi:ABC-type spermidine/putrescine transport system permease subunit I
VAFVLPLGVFLAVFYAIPILRVVAESIAFPHFSLQYFARAFSDLTYLKIIWNTLKMSAVVGIVSVIVGYPIAFWLTRARRMAFAIAMACIVLPLWTSALVRNYAWIIILQRNGIVAHVLAALGLPAPPMLYNEFAVVVGMTYTLLPYTVLTLYGGLRQIKPSYMRAAAALGATPMRAFTSVYLPLSLPAISAATFLVFIFSIGFFITPAMLGGGHKGMIAPEIEQQMNALVQWGFGSALAVILLVIVLGLLGACSRFLDGSVFGFARSKATRESSAPSLPAAAINEEALRALHVTVEKTETAAGRWHRPPRAGLLALEILVGVLLFALIAPVLIIAATSVTTTTYLAFPPQGFTLDWYQRFLGSSQWISATLLSLKVSALAAVGASVLGTLSAIGFVRGEFVGKRAAFMLALAPQIIPAIVLGVGLYLFFAQLHLLGSIWSFVFAYIALTVPIVMLLVSGALRQANIRLERAAATLGANPVRAFVAITLPAIMPTILAAALFAFITAFDEVVIAQFLAGSLNATLPKLMYVTLMYSIDPTISAISTLLVCLSLVIVVVAAFFQRGAQTHATT